MPVWATVLLAVLAPTATITAAICAVFISLRRGQREIHVLVNNRLTEALTEIGRLGGRADEF